MVSQAYAQVYIELGVAAQRKKLARYLLETHPDVARLVTGAQEQLRRLTDGDNAFNAYLDPRGQRARVGVTWRCRRT